MRLAQPYEQARIQVERLVERFDRNLDPYRRPSNKEARMRDSASPKSDGDVSWRGSVDTQVGLKTANMTQQL